LQPRVNVPDFSMRASALAILAGITFVPALADAERGAVALTWSAPAACPSQGNVISEVQRILGGPTEHAVTARADVVQLGPLSWQVHLVTDVDGVGGERSLDSDSCASLASATALILAWTIDPERARAARPPPPPPPIPPSPPPAESPKASRVGPRVQIVLAAEAAGDLGTLPSAALAAQFAVGVLVGRLRFEVSGADWLPQDVTRGGEGSHLHLYEVAGRGCFRWMFSRVEVGPCLGGGLAYMSSDGFNESQPFQNWATWGLVRADVLAAWRIAGPFAVRTSLGLGVPLARPSIYINEPQGSQIVDLYDVPAVVGRATLGLEVRFP
jgi:hypothetical protein